MNFSKRRHNRIAFTLLEVMIATGILGCALIALLTSVNQSHKMNIKAVSFLEKSLLGKAKLAEIMLLDNLSKSSSGSGTFENSPFYSYSFSVAEFISPFDRDLKNTQKSKLLKIDLTIKDKRTRESTYHLVAYTFGKQ